MGYKNICIDCRLSFSEGNNLEKMNKNKSCPECGEIMTFVHQKFKAPKKSDDKQWKKVAFLIENGFRFEPIFIEIKNGVFMPVSYPKTLSEAKEFVAEIKKNPEKYKIFDKI